VALYFNWRRKTYEKNRGCSALKRSFHHQKSMIFKDVQDDNVIWVRGKKGGKKIMA